MLKTKTLQKPTQITFKTNLDLKEKTLQKAKQEGITLKALLTMAMKAYIHNDLAVGVHPTSESLLADKDVIAKANELGKLLQKKQL